MLKPVVTAFGQLLKFYSTVKESAKWWFASLRIRTKFVVVVGLLVIALIGSLSYTFLKNLNNALHERVAETCELSLRHLTQTIKDDLVLHYNTELVPNEQSQHLGFIKEAVFKVNREDMEGLEYAFVVDRYGKIIAHTDMDQINQQVSYADSLTFRRLEEQTLVTGRNTIRLLHPIYAKNAAGEDVFLGVAALGFSRQVITAPIRKVSSSIISIMLFATLFTVLLVLLMARRMTRQIEVLSEGVRRLEEGSLKHRIPVLSNDELGQFATEFNSMLHAMREKKHMQKFLSKFTMRAIQDGSLLSSLPKSINRRKVTLLFSDIRRFSELTEKLAPEQIVELINVYLDVQATIIEKNGGVVDKFIGDEVMAIFDGTDQSDIALQTAIEIQRTIQKLNRKRLKHGQTILTVGVGVHTGFAVMGNMGSQNRMDYTVIGDVVNLARYLCAIAKPGQILAPTQMTRYLTKEYTTKPLSSVRVKGRKSPVELFEIEYEHALAS